MKRIEAIEMILNLLKDEDIAVFSTGMISREAFHVRDRKANLYLLGSMGLASSIGLGLALNTDKNVFVIDGDGSVLMDMGAMVVVGAQKPPNLIHIVLDNGCYQSTGGQPTASDVAHLDEIAIASGYARSSKVATIEELKTALGDTKNKKKGPFFVLIKVSEKPIRQCERVSLMPVQIREKFKPIRKE